MVGQEIFINNHKNKYMTLEEKLALDPKPKVLGRTESIRTEFEAIQSRFVYEIYSFGNFDIVDTHRDLVEIICHGHKFTFFQDERIKKAVQVNGAVWLDLADHEMDGVYKQLKEKKL